MPPRDFDRIRRVSRALKSCREASGYASARAFYDCAGGRSVLRCDYETYRRLEETGRLPKPGTLERIYEGLESYCEPKLLRALARAYAQALLGEELFAWPPGDARRRPRRYSGLPETPCAVWEKIAADPAGLEAVLALENGRTAARDLPGPASGARRALEGLVRAGLARRRGGAFVPVAGAFPVTRTWAPTVEEAEDFRRSLLASMGGTEEIVGGATVFVHSDREDMSELFQHLRGSAARRIKEVRAEAGRNEPVYLLELIIRERVPEAGDDRLNPHPRRPRPKPSRRRARSRRISHA